MRPEASTKDLYLALGATLLGALFVFVAMRARWNPGEMNPGIEGCLGAGVVGTVLLLLHPVAYGRALVVSAPVLAIEYWACTLAGGPAIGVVGLHLLIVGFIGLAVAQRGAAPAAKERANRGLGQH